MWFSRFLNCCYLIIVATIVGFIIYDIRHGVGERIPNDSFTQKVDTYYNRAIEEQFKLKKIPKLREDTLSSNNGLVLSQRSCAELDTFLQSIVSHVAFIENNQTEFIEDIRQETNNQLVKLDTELSYWVALLAVLCGVIPIIMQYTAKHESEAKIRKICDEYEAKMKSFAHSAQSFLLINSLMNEHESQMVTDDYDRYIFQSKCITSSLNILNQLSDLIFDKKCNLSTCDKTDTTLSMLTHLYTIAFFLGIARKDRISQRRINEIKDKLTKCITLQLKPSTIDTNQLTCKDMVTEVINKLQALAGVSY